MWPKVSRSSIYNGSPSLYEHSFGTAYVEFMENRHKLYSDLDDHSRKGYDHLE